MLIFVNGWTGDGFRIENPNHERTLRELYCLSCDLLRAKEELGKLKTHESALVVQRIERQRADIKSKRLPKLRSVE